MSSQNDTHFLNKATIYLHVKQRNHTIEYAFPSQKMKGPLKNKLPRIFQMREKIEHSEEQFNRQASQ